MPDPVTSELESLIEESFDSLQIQFLDLALYISNMPKEYTTGLFSPSGKGTQDKDHLHAPSSEFFDLIVWNIVISFWVSILASSLYDKLFSGRAELKSRDELKAIRGEMITMAETEIRIGNLTLIWKRTKQRSIKLLTAYGVPENEASEKAEEISERLSKTVQKVGETYSRRKENVPFQAHAPIEVFCAYAHEDEPLLQTLEKYLALLKRQGLVSIWHARQIVPGTDWTQAIATHLSSASVILLLISISFLDSDYCYSTEMQRALERHQTNEARVIPILLRPVDWKEAPFAHLQMLPTDARAVTIWSNQDEAFTNVAIGIRKAIEDLMH